EGRPAALGVELRLAAEQLGAAAPAAIDADGLVVLVLTAEGTLGAGLAQHVVLRGAQLGAPLLFGLVGRVGLVAHISACCSKVMCSNRCNVGTFSFLLARDVQSR